MENTVYSIRVLMENQEQVERMKQICLESNLPFLDGCFEYLENKVFCYFERAKIFAVSFKDLSASSKKEVSENEFIELLKQREL